MTQEMMKTAHCHSVNNFKNYLTVLSFIISTRFNNGIGKLCCTTGTGSMGCSTLNASTHYRRGVNRLSYTVCQHLLQARGQ